MEVRRGEPIAVVEHVLRRLERQAIDAGSHPVLIHEGMEALDRLREENARLVQRERNLKGAHTLGTALIARLTRERDEARAEWDKADKLARKRGELLGEVRAEVGRLRAITSPGDAAAFEEHMATREAHWVAQVKRLEGLILDWYEHNGAEAPWIAFSNEARCIRAQREEGQHFKHPTGDYCVWCHSQWPCEEGR